MTSTLYKVQDNVDNMVASDVDQFADALSGANDVGQLTLFLPLAAPAAPTVGVNTTAGNLNGAYKYAVAFVTGYWKGTIGVGTMFTQGNTGGGTASATVSPASQQVNLTAIPTGPVGTVARILYRTKAGGSSYFFVQQINDNTTTSWTDNVADTSLTQAMPTTNTTGTQLITGLPIQITVPTGTAPLIVASTTMVTNLNANQVNSFSFNQSLQTTDTPTFAKVTVTAVPVATTDLVNKAYADQARNYAP